MNLNKSFVYIVADPSHEHLITGYASNLIKKIKSQRKNKKSQFNQSLIRRKLVYYEIFDEISSAVVRERALQEWELRQKINLINNLNPDWEDLTQEIMCKAYLLGCGSLLL